MAAIVKAAEERGWSPPYPDLVRLGVDPDPKSILGSLSAQYLRSQVEVTCSSEQGQFLFRWRRFPYQDTWQLSALKFP